MADSDFEYQNDSHESDEVSDREALQLFLWFDLRFLMRFNSFWLIFKIVSIYQKFKNSNDLTSDDLNLFGKDLLDRSSS